MDTSDLTGRKVVVTGAGSGIGRETALLAARRDAGLAQTEQEATRLGRTVTARHVDVSDREQLRSLADDVGAPDILVNNAGVGLAGDFLDMELEDWDWIVPINLLGVVYGCHFFIPKMVERGAGGHVVNLSSMAGYLPSPGLSAYSATKFAVLGLSEALREELKPHGIGVTAICPGVINTPITRSTRARGAAADPAWRERAVKAFERRNYGPEKVAANILKAVQRERTVAPISPEAHLAYALKRTSPRVAGWISRKAGEINRQR